MTETPRSAEQRRTVVLEAAAERLKHAQLEWLKGLTFDDLVNDTGIDRARIAKDFGSKEALGEALIDHCLNPTSWDTGWLSEISTELEGMLSDPSVRLIDAAYAIADMEREAHLDSSDHVGQIAIWSLSHGDERARAKLGELYSELERETHEAFEVVLERYAELGVGFRPGITIAQTLAIFTAMVEGLALRAAVDEQLATPELWRIAFAMLAESLFTTVGDDDPIGSRLDSVDERRRQG